MTLKSPIRAALAEGRPVGGFWHLVRDIAITESLRDCGIDFMVVDMQHGVIDLAWIEQLIIALHPSDVSVLVRPPVNDAAIIGQVLDLGADGVIVPMVETAAQARAAVGAVLYPPEGIRSWGPRRLPRYADADEYARLANENAVVLVQIETAESLRNVDEIAAVPGVTAVMVGPTDLAISMGYGEDRDNPAVTEAAMEVRDRCAEKGVPFGFFARPLEEAQDWLARGAQIVACETDSWFIAQGISRLLSGFAGARAEQPLAQ